MDELVVGEQQLREVLLLRLGHQHREKALNGIRGITDVTPAACSFSTTSVESLAVVDVSEVCGRESRPPASRRCAFEVGQQVLGQRRLVAGPVTDDHAHLGLVRSIVPLLLPQVTSACRRAASSGPVHHR